MDDVLATLDGEPIREADLQLAMLIRRIDPSAPNHVRRQLLVQLVEERLIRAHLDDRKVQPAQSRVEERLQRAYKWIRQTGRDPGDVLSSIGSSEAALRRELELPIAWAAYVNRVVTPKRIRDYFMAHRAELDGTQVRASHILLRLPADDPEAVQRAAERLGSIRQRVVEGELTFAEAAAEYSESPSGRQGGDLGFFPFQGQMPTSMTKVVFPLEVGEISQTFPSRFGMHLAQVTERKAGDLSLEDARPQVLGRLSQELWQQTLAPLREKSTVEFARPVDLE